MTVKPIPLARVALTCTVETHIRIHTRTDRQYGLAVGRDVYSVHVLEVYMYMYMYFSAAEISRNVNFAYD